MSTEISTAWIYIAVLCFFGLFLPSVRPANWRIAVGDRAFPFLFPVRALLSKIVCKPKWLKTFTDVRVEGRVNFTGVFWSIVAALAVVVMAAETALRFFSDTALGLFVSVLVYALLLLYGAMIVGVFTSDNKSREKIPIPDVDADDIHLVEQQIAFMVGERIAEDQCRVAPLGYQWHIDVFCTNKLDDSPSKALGSALVALTGAPPMNPVYMSRIIVTLLDGDDAVKIPFGRKVDVDISYTQNKTLILLGADRVVTACAEEVADITRMVLHKKGLAY